MQELRHFGKLSTTNLRKLVAPIGMTGYNCVSCFTFAAFRKRVRTTFFDPYQPYKTEGPWRLALDKCTRDKGNARMLGSSQVCRDCES
eukprot:jgi/Botrbrau1/19451/Bobra.0338s0072.2